MAKSIIKGLQSGEIRFMRKPGYIRNKETGLWEEYNPPLLRPQPPPDPVTPTPIKVTIEG